MSEPYIDRRAMTQEEYNKVLASIVVRLMKQRRTNHYIINYLNEHELHTFKGTTGFLDHLIGY